MLAFFNFRLDFNLVLVDDDLSDEDDREGIDNLLKKIATSISSKGFELNSNCYVSIADANANTHAHHRVDLFLSDNNLGNNSQNIDENLNNGGIEFYLSLRQQPYLCDFVLYTRADVDEIVNKLSTNLIATNNPNLFTRFTFVNRDETDNWHMPIIGLLDHILTKREELNNIRGLYAQQASKMDQHLKIKYSIDENKDFHDAINLIPNALGVDKRSLHEIRKIRNGLMHNDEEWCNKSNEYVLRFTTSGKNYEIFESNLQHYRQLLNNAYSLVMSLP